MTVLRLATEATGLVQMIQHAFTSPAAIRRNISTVPPAAASPRIVPGGRPHNSSVNARSSAFSAERWPGSPGPM